MRREKRVTQPSSETKQTRTAALPGLARRVFLFFVLLSGAKEDPGKPVNAPKRRLEEAERSRLEERRAAGAPSKQARFEEELRAFSPRPPPVLRPSQTNPRPDKKGERLRPPARSGPKERPPGQQLGAIVLSRLVLGSGFVSDLRNGCGISPSLALPGEGEAAKSSSGGWRSFRKQRGRDPLCPAGKRFPPGWTRLAPSAI